MTQKMGELTACERGGRKRALGERATHEQATALWVAAFLDELTRWGVRDFVVSPGSRSTALAMAAFELSRRSPERARLYVDVDERGAAFLGLGLAKASGRPAALVCTSGTALANYYPAVMEAETSRVPLIVLSGDRPPQLQGVGAPQTTDQLKAYGDHVRAFRAMPLPDATDAGLGFVRQAAREVCLAALGGAGGIDGDRYAGGAASAAAGDAEAHVQVASRGCARMAGPVHVNFPFDEPLKPDFPGADALAADGLDDAASGDCFAAGRSAGELPALLGAGYALDVRDVHAIEAACAGKHVLVMAGEGTCETLAQARRVVAWARAMGYPLLADPLSGLRAVDDPLVIDNYDNVFRNPSAPQPDVVIRFGRFPISKSATKAVEAARRAGAVQAIVVDCAQTRDFNFATDTFVAADPLSFATAAWSGAPDEAQLEFARAWIAENDAARERILAVGAAPADEADCFEGAYVRKLLELAPADSCVFSANSMSIRAIDTFLVKDGKPLCVLCNRGQNGIDGTTSTALGAAQNFAQTTYLTGDFTMLHDLSALALQREMLVHHGGAQASSMVIVLLNNNGGAIFDMLPQASGDDYFERLFLVPQDVRFEQAARAFSVPYRAVSTVEGFALAYEELLGTPGVSLIEVTVPLRGVRERYGKFQK